MKLFWGLGKILTLGFWGVVLVNQLFLLPSPFEILIKLAGSLVLLTHILELFLYSSSLRERPHAWRDRLQILVFGIFHIQSFSAPSAEASHA